ncbi:hypothetical protein DMENIID0001_103920 [Sergentomyia squamirostris]
MDLDLRDLETLEIKEEREDDENDNQMELIEFVNCDQTFEQKTGAPRADELIPALIAELALKLKQGSQLKSHEKPPDLENGEEGTIFLEGELVKGESLEEEEEGIYPLLDVIENSEDLNIKESICCGNCGEILLDEASYSSHIETHRKKSPCPLNLETLESETNSGSDLADKEDQDVKKKRQSYSLVFKQEVLDAYEEFGDTFLVAKKMNITERAVRSIRLQRQKIQSVAHLVSPTCKKISASSLIPKNHDRSERSWDPLGPNRRQSYSLQMKRKVIEDSKTKSPAEIARKLGITVRTVRDIIRKKESVLSIPEHVPISLTKIRGPRLRGDLKKDRPKESKVQSRKSFSLQFKVEVLQELEESSTVEVARKFNISPLTVKSFRRRRGRILSAAKGAPPLCRRVKPGVEDLDKMEKRLLKWIQENRDGGHLGKEEIQTKAIRIYYDLKCSGQLSNPKVFAATSSWYDKFRKKYGLSFGKIKNS